MESVVVVVVTVVVGFYGISVSGGERVKTAPTLTNKPFEVVVGDSSLGCAYSSFIP